MEKLYGIIGSQASGGSISLLDVHATEINCKSTWWVSQMQ